MAIKNYFLLLTLLFLVTVSNAQTKKIQATSKDVGCWVDLDPGKKAISHVYVQIDVTTFNSENSNRDSHAMEVIDAISYPKVKFTSTSIVQTGDKLKITGKLTFHGITKEITFDAMPKWESDKLTVTGNFVISLTEFKVERPSLLMIQVKDELRFSFVEVLIL